MAIQFDTTIDDDLDMKSGQMFLPAYWSNTLHSADGAQIIRGWRIPATDPKFNQAATLFTEQYNEVAKSGLAPWPVCPISLEEISFKAGGQTEEFWIMPRMTVFPIAKNIASSLSQREKQAKETGMPYSPWQKMPAPQQAVRSTMRVLVFIAELWPLYQEPVEITVRGFANNELYEVMALHANVARRAKVLFNQEKMFYGMFSTTIGPAPTGKQVKGGSEIIPMRAELPGVVVEKNGRKSVQYPALEMRDVTTAYLEAHHNPEIVAKSKDFIRSGALEDWVTTQMDRMKVRNTEEVDRNGGNEDMPPEPEAAFSLDDTEFPDEPVNPPYRPQARQAAPVQPAPRPTPAPAPARPASTATATQRADPNGPATNEQIQALRTLQRNDLAENPRLTYKLAASFLAAAAKNKK